MKINHYTYPNGLRLVHSQQGVGVLVSTTVLYNVGARFEKRGKTGLAHLMEHMMFGGSEHIKDYTSEIELAGGQDNAWTSTDFTSYYAVVPVQNLEIVLRAESDRMFSPLLSEKTFRTQKSVVVEEFKQQCLNRPYGRVEFKWRQLLYKEHPYRYPVIGKSIHEVESLRREDVLAWHKDYYRPDNAIISIVGPIDFETVKALVGKWFACGESDNTNQSDNKNDTQSDNESNKECLSQLAPKTPLKLPTLPREEPAKHPRHCNMTDNVPQTLIMMGWIMPAYGEEGFLEYDLVTDLLAYGTSSRLYRNLVVGSDLFTQADASITGNEDQGYLQISATLTDSSEEAIRKAKKLLMEQARLLCKEGEISDYELQRCINRRESELIFKYANSLELSQALALCEVHNEDLEKNIEKLRQITVEQVTNAARDMFNRPACTLVCRPSQSPEQMQQMMEQMAQMGQAELAQQVEGLAVEEAEDSQE